MLVPLLSSRPVAAIATRLVGRGIPIFMLHRMTHKSYLGSGMTTQDHLRRCLQYLVSNKYTFLSLEDLVQGLRNGHSLPPKAVVFTMDDGFSDQAEIAAPIFIEFECPLTAFLITGMVDQRLWPWDAQISWITENSKQKSLQTTIGGTTLSLKLEDENNRRLAKRALQDAIRELHAEQVPGIMKQLAQDAGIEVPESAPPSYKPMNWDTVRQLENEGIRFSPHSVTHNILSMLDRELMEKEIQNSWITITRELVNPLKIFCYPSGRLIDFSTREIEALENSGFLGAVTSTPGYLKPGNISQSQLFRLPRFALPHAMDDFVQYCSWIEYAKVDYRNSPEQV